MMPASFSRRTPAGRRRGRPPGSNNAARAARLSSHSEVAMAVFEPPPKRRRYIPGGPGGGGRFVDTDDFVSPSRLSTTAASRARATPRDPVHDTPSVPRRERSSRIQGIASEDAEHASWGSAAAVAASVKQADDYKPREERSWEEFHPSLDIESKFMVFRAQDVDGLPQDGSHTPSAQPQDAVPDSSMTPSRSIKVASTGNTPNPPGHGETNALDAVVATPARRSRRTTREMNSLYGARSTEPIAGTPKTPKILPIHHQTARERLDLKNPSYRKSNRIELFESKSFGQARYVDKAMSNVGYQESDEYVRPEKTLIRAVDGSLDEDIDPSASVVVDEQSHQSRIGRVEYDMDEQDDMWLEQSNAQRKQNGLEAITREIFEITMTKIEKEWHALEKRIPKPNPKPPQTHRLRSSSAVAVNGEPQAGDEPDSKCAICDDGDCENTNAIVFCDGCNLAVHQECYGVPFIPEGQWLCRKCQLCGRGIPTCIFCPNTDGAFKQTNSSKWAHLLCAMWIPEVSLGNHTFMEPVMDVEKVPKNRWKLACYICNQRMGACIQCGNKNCYQAFHVTCARRARLFLKMKTAQGALAVLDGSMVLKAFCDRHCPSDYTQENNVRHATRVAKKFYKRNMAGRIWADSPAMANVIAAQHRNFVSENGWDEPQGEGQRLSGGPGDKKKSQPPKNLWKLPSGAPIIPQAVFDTVESSVQRFSFRKRKEFVGEACRYWTLKREARRGAALLKRLQLQMDSFSSMELTRRDWASMGPSGKARLSRRIAFTEELVKDLERLRELSDDIVLRQQLKLNAAEMEQEFVDECYFPVVKLLVRAVDKAISLDKELFSAGLAELRSQVEERFHVTALPFAQALGGAVSSGIRNPPSLTSPGNERIREVDNSPMKTSFADIRERRRLGRRIIKAVQPYLETALRIESEISQKPYENFQKELVTILDASLDPEPQLEPNRDQGQDQYPDDQATILVGAPGRSQFSVPFQEQDDVRQKDAEENAMDTTEDGDLEDGGNIDVDTSGLNLVNDDELGEEVKNEYRRKSGLSIGTMASDTPPNTDGYLSAPGATQTTGPPTPPQSNGSLGKEPSEPLTEGGVLWYLKMFQPRGTSVVEEQWLAGRDAVRMLSEDLTDMDDEELKVLGVDVDESVTAAAASALAAEERLGRNRAKSGRLKRSRTSTRRR